MRSGVKYWDFIVRTEKLGTSSSFSELCTESGKLWGAERRRQLWSDSSTCGAEFRLPGVDGTASNTADLV